jgi:hypothetical protein
MEISLIKMMAIRAIDDDLVDGRTVKKSLLWFHSAARKNGRRPAHYSRPPAAPESILLAPPWGRASQQ